MSLKKFLNESIKNEDKKYKGFVSSDYSDSVNESKENGFTMKQIEDMSNDDFATGKKSLSDILHLGNNTYGKVWYKNYLIKKQNGRIAITDMTNAMKRGKSLKEWVIYTTFGGNNMIVSFSNYLQSMGKLTESFESFMDTLLPTLLDIGEPLYLKEDGSSAQSGEADCSINVRVDEVKAFDTFSPYAISNIKPLKKMPKKWRVNDIIKAIANNQYSYLGRDYKMTDDYAYDVAYKYGKTDSLNPIDMIEKLIENPRWYNHIYKGNSEKDIEGEIEAWRFGSSNETFTIVVNLTKTATTPKNAYDRAMDGKKS